MPGQERDLGPLVLWTVADVTGERAHHVATVRSLEASLARYDAVPAGLMWTDNRGVIRHMNATLLRWLGREPLALAERALRLRDIFTQPGADLIETAADTPQSQETGLDLDVAADEGRAMPMRLFARREAAGGLLVATYLREAAAEPDGDAAEIRFARFFQSAPFGIAILGPTGASPAPTPPSPPWCSTAPPASAVTAADALCRCRRRPTRAHRRRGRPEARPRRRAGRGPIEITVGAADATT